VSVYLVLVRDPKAPAGIIADVLGDLGTTADAGEAGKATGRGAELGAQRG